MILQPPNRKYFGVMLQYYDKISVELQQFTAVWMMINQFFNQTGIYQEYFIYEEMEKEESTNEASLWESNIVLIWSVILGILF